MDFGLDRGTCNPLKASTFSLPPLYSVFSLSLFILCPSASVFSSPPPLFCKCVKQTHLKNSYLFIPSAAQSRKNCCLPWELTFELWALVSFVLPLG